MWPDHAKECDRCSTLVVNGSDYTLKHVHWYLIALPHSATYLVAASQEHERTGRLGVWMVSIVVFMLADATLAG